MVRGGDLDVDIGGRLWVMRSFVGWMDGWMNGSHTLAHNPFSFMHFMHFMHKLNNMSFSTVVIVIPCTIPPFTSITEGWMSFLLHRFFHSGQPCSRAGVSLLDYLALVLGKRSGMGRGNFV